jgi:hypothetical protein
MARWKCARSNIETHNTMVALVTDGTTLRWRALQWEAGTIVVIDKG